MHHFLITSYRDINLCQPFVSDTHVATTCHDSNPFGKQCHIKHRPANKWLKYYTWHGKPQYSFRDSKTISFGVVTDDKQSITPWKNKRIVVNGETWSLTSTLGGIGSEISDSLRDEPTLVPFRTTDVMTPH